MNNPCCSAKELVCFQNNVDRNNSNSSDNQILRNQNVNLLVDDPARHEYRKQPPTRQTRTKTALLAQQQARRRIKSTTISNFIRTIMSSSSTIPTNEYDDDDESLSLSSMNDDTPSKNQVSFAMDCFNFDQFVHCRSNLHDQQQPQLDDAFPSKSTNLSPTNDDNDDDNDDDDNDHHCEPNVPSYIYIFSETIGINCNNKKRKIDMMICPVRDTTGGSGGDSRAKTSNNNKKPYKSINRKQNWEFKMTTTTTSTKNNKIPMLESKDVTNELSCTSVVSMKTMIGSIQPSKTVPTSAKLSSSSSLLLSTKMVSLHNQCIESMKHLVKNVYYSHQTRQMILQLQKQQQLLPILLHNTKNNSNSIDSSHTTKKRKNTSDEYEKMLLDVDNIMNRYCVSSSKRQPDGVDFTRQILYNPFFEMEPICLS